MKTNKQATFVRASATQVVVYQESFDDDAITKPLVGWLIKVFGEWFFKPKRKYVFGAYDLDAITDELKALNENVDEDEK